MATPQGWEFGTIDSISSLFAGLHPGTVGCGRKRAHLLVFNRGKAADAAHQGRCKHRRTPRRREEHLDEP